MLKEKRLAVKKMVLRLMLSLMVGVFAGAAPGAAMMSYGAENPVVAQAVVPEAAEVQESDGSMFILYFFGGILLLILLVAVIVVATAVSTAGVLGAQEDE